jgi:hypothetical protein
MGWRAVWVFFGPSQAAADEHPDPDAALEETR